MHDGGILTVLPYLLQKSRIWKKCRLRIFAVAQMEDNSIAMQRDLEGLLARYRINAEAHTVELGGNDVSEFVYEKTLRMQRRDELLQKMQVKGSLTDLMIQSPTSTQQTKRPYDGVTGEGWLRLETHPLHRNKEKIDFMTTSVKLNITIKQESSSAALIFLSLPPPSPLQSSSDYMEYLDALTADLPRVMLVKGSGAEIVSAYF